jgi:hypothetical protein
VAQVVKYLLWSPEHWFQTPVQQKERNATQKQLKVIFQMHQIRFKQKKKKTPQY